MRRLTLSLLTIVLSVQFVFAQSFTEELQQAAEDNKLIGMSVVAVCEQGIFNRYHYGFSDLENEIPVTNETAYRIASISKTVTALGLMNLYEEGNFELDDNVSDYLAFDLAHPDYPDNPITFRMLLAHTSGLNDGSGYSPFLTASYNNMPPPNISEVLTQDGSYYTGDMYLNHEPGSYFQYANINYGLIGTLIEAISGERFDIYMKEFLFDPLEISGSFNIQDLPDISNLAVLYRNAIPQADDYNGIMPVSPDYSLYTPGTNAAIFAPQGGLRITALDLAKIMLMMINKGVGDAGSYTPIQMLEEETINLMMNEEWAYDGGNGNNYYDLFNSWGLGIHRTTNTPGGDIVINGLPMYGHPGEAYGLISDMYYDPVDEYGLIFITNGYYNGGAYQVANNSAFYQPEEDVFGILRQYTYGSCLVVDVVNTTESSFSISPVPARSYIEINGIQDIQSIEIFDSNGRQCLTQENGTSRIDVSKLRSGIYTVRVVNVEGVYVEEFLK
jgi:CubicO group peptidase (beta-lactamase class C family)